MRGWNSVFKAVSLKIGLRELLILTAKLGSDGSYKLHCDRFYFDPHLHLGLDCARHLANVCMIP